ncbi:MAG: type I polyketide synthase [Anaerolineae bacterium]|nr:type I polyketide synthase [Anaerolineae bacterium]
MNNNSHNNINISSVKRALLARQLRSQIDGLEVLQTEPVAITGIGCRFPGGANHPEAFWSLLENGVDAISKVPADRWDSDALYDPKPGTPGKITTQWGGFLNQVDQFDPDYFGISPREALRMDPQQRIFLEVATEAWEDAGLIYDKLVGSQTGVFVASYHNDYAQLQYADPNQIDAYTSTGSAHSIVANRLSYILDLQGPSVTVDTACSSSLVAIHLACQSLRNGECNMALAGAVSLMLSPEVTISLSNWGFMTPDGRCKTFDARADGFVRGEGCGVVVLKRLADALMDGDNILAVIRGSAVNQDGRTNVLTAPSGQAQQAVVQQALNNAGLTPDQISYIEAHGTGTSLGDPIEVEALAQVIGSRSSDNLCVLGSVKTNIGHLEAAAGIAGLIKVVLSLQHQTIPPHLHFNKINPHIELDHMPFIIPTRLHPWPMGTQRRYAGVSSFGFGGTNAHIIVEEAPSIPATDRNEENPQAFLLPLSAHSSETLQALVESFQCFFEDIASKDTNQGAFSPNLRDICYTASVRRNHHNFRIALIGNSPQSFSEQLKALLHKNIYSNFDGSRRTTDAFAKPVFVFSGQGPQWWAMGRELLASEPVFRGVIEQCDELLHHHADWSLLRELTASEEESRLDQTEFAQPAIFALQVGLAALWRSWDILPSVVVGHSVGEIAAAHVAGVLTLEDAISIVFHRAKLMQEATGCGQMAAIGVSFVEAERLIKPYGERLSIAAVNSPTSVVLSGEKFALDEVLQSLQDQGIFNRKLPVNYAFHSHQMAPYQKKLTTVLSELVSHSPSIPIISTVTGTTSTPQDFDAAYWGRNIREAVRFAPAIESLIQDGFSLFLEIGPHPVLTQSIQQCLSHHDQPGTVLPSLRRNKTERSTMLNSLGAFYTQGYKIEWKNLYSSQEHLVRLPVYPWQRKRYWFTPARHLISTKSRRETFLHPLLGQQIHSPALKDIVFETELEAGSPHFLEEHRIFGTVIVPATAYLEMACAAASTAFGPGSYFLEEVTLQEVLTLPQNHTQTIQLILTPSADRIGTFQIYSLTANEKKWKLHVSGKIRVDSAKEPTPHDTLDNARARCLKAIKVETHYQNFYERGLEFGPGFQGVEQLWRSDMGGEILAQVQLPETLISDLNKYQAHPALFDACLQPLMTIITSSESEEAYLPISLGTFCLYHRFPARLWSNVQLQTNNGSNQETVVGNFYFYDESGQLVAEVTGLHVKRTNRQTLQKVIQMQDQKSSSDDGLYEVKWQEQARSATKPQSEMSDSWLILVDQDGIGMSVVDQLRQHGQTCITVSPADDFGLISQDHWQVNPAQPADFEKLVREALPTQNQGWRGILHLWSLDAVPAEDMTLEELNASQVTDSGSLLYLTQALARINQNQPPGLWLVTSGTQPAGVLESLTIASAPLWGLVATIGLEYPDWRCIRIDLDPRAKSNSNQSLFEEIWLGDGESQVAFRNGSRYVARLTPLAVPAVLSDVPLKDNEAQPFRLEIPARGTVENLTFLPTNRQLPGPGEVEIRVQATGLNFRDVLNVLGMFGDEDPGPLGQECTGEVVAVGPGVTHVQVGDKVMGMAQGSFSTYVTTLADLVTPIPPHLTLEEAATIPITFLTAYYALHHLGNIAAGDRVLIHAAAGGVGLAAVQLAKRAGAEIFGTAGNPEKRAYLKTLGVSQVMDSRTLDFADEIMDYTNNQGVDIILNSLTGDFIAKNVSVLKPRGRFLEIGKIGIWDQDQMAQAKPDVAYFIIFLGDLCQNNPSLIQSMLQDISVGLTDGSLVPLTHRVFQIQAVIEAFRYMAQAKHIGKIVITQTSSGRISPDATYLITGGLGGLGLETAQWLSTQGAKHLVLVGRSVASEDAKQTIKKLEQDNVQIMVAQADVSKHTDLARILSIIEQDMPPIRGIFHAAGIVSDAVLMQQTWSKFMNVMAPKVEGAWHLHTLTRQMPLDFFVMYSSAASVLGSAGQSNYAGANAFLDALAHFRRSSGLPALTVNWGPWANVGMTAVLDSQEQQRWARQGLTPLNPNQGMHLLEQALSANSPQVCALFAHWPTYIRSYAAEKADLLFSELVGADDADRRRESTTSPDLLQQLASVPRSKQRNFLLTHIHRRACLVLGLDPAHPIDSEQPLNELGLDSLMAVELRNILSNDVNNGLPATLLFDYPTLKDLAEYLSQKLLANQNTIQTSAQGPESASRTQAISELESLSDDEAEALLLAELNNMKGQS